MRVPRRPGLVVPVLCGVVAGVALAPAGGVAILALFAIAPLVAGVRRTGPLQAHLGGGVLVVAVLVAGYGSAPRGLVLVATVASVVAWDAATTAITLDRQVTPMAETARAEIVHSGATLAVGAVLAGGVYLVTLLPRGTTPVTAAVLVIVGAIALLAVLDPRTA